jgi:hypothetical protein
MALSFSNTLRDARSTAIVSAAGAGAKIKYYDGTRPATGVAIDTQTLLATLVCGSVIGTVSGRVLTFGAVTQTNTNHVSGTPTWVRITTSADVFVADLSVGSDLTFTGTITTGVDIALGATTITEGNA